MNGILCLRLLATKALERLERNKTWNKNETNDENLVPRAEADGTTFQVDICDLRESFEGRLVICE